MDWYYASTSEGSDIFLDHEIFKIETNTFEMYLIGHGLSAFSFFHLLDELLIFVAAED